VETKYCSDKGTSISKGDKMKPEKLLRKLEKIHKKHGIYIEVFCGNLAVFKDSKKDNKLEIMDVEFIDGKYTVKE